MSKTKTVNPYRKGTSYSKVFADLARGGKNGVTRKSLMNRHPLADVTVVLSPRAEGDVREGADCRGNLSSQGHIYYVSKRTGKKDGIIRFVLNLRTKVMEKAKRIPKTNKVAQKKTATKAKAKVKVTEKVTAKA